MTGRLETSEGAFTVQIGRVTNEGSKMTIFCVNLKREPIDVRTVRVTNECGPSSFRVCSLHRKLRVSILTSFNFVLYSCIKHLCYRNGAWPYAIGCIISLIENVFDVTWLTIVKFHLESWLSIPAFFSHI